MELVLFFRPENCCVIVKEYNIAPQRNIAHKTISSMGDTINLASISIVFSSY